MLIGVAVAALAISACGRSPRADSSEAAPPVLLVGPEHLARVEVRRLEAGVPFTGELRPHLTVSVKAHIVGDLEAVHVREGERVRAGQPLARFEPRDTADRHATAEADLLAARAQATSAESDLRRVERLLAAGAASPAELEAAKALAEAAAARVRLAEAARNRSAEDVEKLDVPSPIAGVVSQRLVHPGDHMAAGDPLMTVVSTDILELAASIPAGALARARVGSPVRFQVDAFPGETFSGQVARVNPVTEPGTRQVQIYAQLPNPDGRLVGGLFATGRVVDAVAEKALAVPVATLRQEEDGRVVYAVKNGVATRIPVATGLADEAAGMVEVLTPGAGGAALAAGDSLLVGTLPGLRPGAVIRVTGAGGAGTR
jgi:RND family efflux transporter MFP subunit